MNRASTPMEWEAATTIRSRESIAADQTQLPPESVFTLPSLPNERSRLHVRLVASEPEGSHATAADGDDSPPRVDPHEPGARAVAQGTSHLAIVRERSVEVSARPITGEREGVVGGDAGSDDSPSAVDRDRVEPAAGAEVRRHLAAGTE